MATSDSLPNPEFTEALIPEIAEMLGDATDGRAEKDREPLGATSEPVISFGHVSIWLSDRKILDNVSFTVNRGETLCILGRSGVGKSVALRILMGFLKPQVGSIRLGGEEINAFTEEDMRAVRKKVTMVFQNGALFDSLSVRENVAFPLRELGGLAEDQIEEIVGRLIAMVGAEDVADAFPASLSTGRKRAVAIARALAAQPEVVLYDEPTTMVDPIIARRLGDLIQRLKRQLGFTSIVVTHDMRFAEKLADQVLFLDQGRASYFGPLRGFLESPELHIQQFLALDAYVLP
ncbi:MAG TPA: ATP-binding cassette domain-containing protein [Terracidiphilus sp.]|jgi:phospholipid/cholesterol/gamma-HCH transport system ATP-binding protein